MSMNAKYPDTTIDQFLMNHWVWPENDEPKKHVVDQLWQAAKNAGYEWARSSIATAYGRLYPRLAVKAVETKRKATKPRALKADLIVEQRLAASRELENLTLARRILDDRIADLLIQLS